MKVVCRADPDCLHEVCLEFDSTSLATLFFEKVTGAVESCKIGSEWDDTVEDFVDDLLSLVEETVDIDSVPKAPVCITVLDGGLVVTYVRTS